MKKMLAVVLCLLMLLSIAACGSKKTEAPAATAAPAAEKPAEKPAEQPAGEKPAEQPAALDLSFDPFTITLAHDCGPTTPTTPAAELFKERVEAMSEGKITVDIFGGGQLSNSNSATTISMLQGGEVDMAIIMGLQNDLWDIYKLPYLFTTLDEVYASEAGESGQYMLNSLRDSGIIGHEWLDVGFRVFTAKKPLNNVADVAGLKVRIIASTAFTNFVNALGAYPVSMSMGELYTGLEQGAADAQENPLATIVSRALYEPTPYVTLTNHVWTYYIMASNLEWFEGLPASAQEIIKTACKEMAEFHRKTAEEYQDGFKKTITDAGGTIVELTDEELAKWAEIGRSTHKDMESVVGKDVLELFYKDLGIQKSW